MLGLSLVRRRNIPTVHLHMMSRGGKPAKHSFIMAPSCQHKLGQRRNDWPTLAVHRRWFQVMCNRSSPFDPGGGKPTLNAFERKTLKQTRTACGPQTPLPVRIEEN